MYRASLEKPFVAVRAFVALGLFLGVGGAVAQDAPGNGSQKPECTTWKLKQAAEATECARRLVGLKDDVRADAKLVTIENDQTPFLAEKINGREVWAVTVNDWSLELKSAPGEKDSYRRTLDVLLDPVTGQILKLKTRWPENVPEPQDTIEPDAKTAERHILPEKYHGFPSEPPPISFVEALEGADWGDAALVAKRIDALWVLWSKMDSKEPRPMWVITLWGIPPIPVFRAESNVPAYMRETLRIVVNPVTKRSLFASQDVHRVPVEEAKP